MRLIRIFGSAYVAADVSAVHVEDTCVHLQMRGQYDISENVRYECDTRKEAQEVADRIATVLNAMSPAERGLI